MPSPLTSITEFNAAVADVQAAATAYYDTDTLLMSDAEFDTLVDAITAAMLKNPTRNDNGIVSKVAAGAALAGDYPHTVPMLSLAKTNTTEGLASFVATYPAGSLVTEVKLDGMAVSVSYINGRMGQALTRGDGFTGEDITAKCSQINGLPVLTLDASFTGTVRGEIFMTDTDFTASNVNRVASGKPAFANPRNAVAGSIRKEGSTSVMSFAAYDHVNPSAATHVEAMQALTNLGFQTAISLIPTAAGNPADEVALIGATRDNLGFPIDGAVIKLNNLASRAAVGNTSHSPRWAIAYKYAALETTSVITGINVTVGRTGRIAYTATVKPVNVGGVVVTNATLHNPEFIATHKLGIGSQVLVTRANDVIPRIVSLPGVVSDIPAWTPPTTCPECEEPLDRSEVNWRCETPSCSVTGLITYFCARDCMDIEGVGTVVSEALVDAGLVANVADLYELTLAQLTNLPLGENRTLGKLNATKILANIENSKQQPLNRVVTALGIRKTGRTMGRRLAAHYTTMAALQAASITSLTNVEGIAEGKAAYIHAGLKTNKEVIARLAAHGVNMGTTKNVDTKTTAGSLPFAGCTYVVSGSVPGFSRTTVGERIEALGGKAGSSISTTTTALVADTAGTSSKIVKAKQLGIPIIDPAEFAQMLS